MTAISQDDARRAAVRTHRNEQGQRDLNGLDYLEVGADHTSLTVYFLGKLSRPLREDRDALKQAVRIEGGRRIRDIRVLDVVAHHDSDPERDDFMVVRVDKPGDHSTYTLRTVGLQGIDPRYDRIPFSFMVDCTSDLDCGPAAPTEPPALPGPEISYLAKDYTSFHQLILDRLALLMPGWQERHVPDIGLALVELLAYTGDQLSYYQDAVATEAYLDTARQRVSVRRHARLVDYHLGEGCNARAWVCLETNDDLPELPPGIRFSTAPGDAAEVFEPLPGQSLRLVASHSRIDFHTWGQRSCSLAPGTTSATLLDHWVYRDEAPAPGQESARRGAAYQQMQPKQPPAEPRPINRQRVERSLDLRAGDVLIFEELLGPRTGIEPDADPAHRHAVCLTRVTLGEDAVVPQTLQASGAAIELPTPVVEIEWAAADALPFPLVLSVVVPNATCQYVEHISVARGNVVLVDHGRTVQPAEELGVVPPGSELLDCRCDGQPGDVARTPGRFRPRLPTAPLTYRQAPPTSRARASALLQQDPSLALPQVWLHSALPGQTSQRPWEPRPDLLSSGPDERHFVVEVENDGRARLRFGDDELGEQPEAGEVFWAGYRVGNGPAGNVGAEAIAHVLWPEGAAGARIDRVRNPLPASGGVAAESMAEAKLMAPGAFRKSVQRAVTADDYARLAERHPAVQRAAATLSWTGSWYEAEVAVDAWDSETPDKRLLTAVKGSLHRYRRMGHDLRVEAARTVPLAITLEVCVLPGVLRSQVKAALLDVFSSGVLPNGRLGFFHPDQLTFGDGVYLSRLVATAQAVPGVESVRVTQLERQFEGPNGELADGLLPLGSDEIAQVASDPDFPEHGQLMLVLKGGR